MPPPTAPTRRRLDVGIAGTRGVPARYGGFETFAEELGARLAARDHRVTVYGRIPYVGRHRRTHRGIHVVPVWGPRGKHLETPLHTLATALHTRRARHDALIVCNAANAFALPLLSAGAPTVLNLDGVERHRRKWGRAGRAWYALAERLALRLADVPLADARVIQDYYRARHRVDLPVIPYGGDRALDPDTSILHRAGLTPHRYALVVGRLEPENNALLAVRARPHWRADLPLVVVGDAPYARPYKRQLHRAATPDTRFLGGVYDAAYAALQANAAVYIAAGEVGGTHPALLEAMALGAPVVANDVPEHREVLGDAGLYYRPHDPRDLARAVDALLGQPDRGASLQHAARAVIQTRYTWDLVTQQYEDLLLDLTQER